MEMARAARTARVSNDRIMVEVYLIKFDDDNERGDAPVSSERESRQQQAEASGESVWLWMAVKKGSLSTN